MKATVLVVNDSTRELLAKMKFPEIPEEAKYIAFGEDGEAIFMSKLDLSRHLVFPKITMVSYYDVDNIAFE
jgi:hypothetical protein